VRGPSVTGFSFDAVDADTYERLRPGYSRDAVAWLLTTATRAHDGLVVDLAAGTGKLTGMLADAGVAAVAVEPSATMRTVLRSVTRASVIAAIAEALPFGNSTLGCVCVAQAFHHLHSARAIPELHRVLGPGGHLALVWNLYEANDPLKQAMDRILDATCNGGGRRRCSAIGGRRSTAHLCSRLWKAAHSSIPTGYWRTPSPICSLRRRTWPPSDPSFGARSLKRSPASQRRSHRRS
jgi:SAM-dependent methyltransferase